jgi:uncharacterized protein involved in exopolysaccharide biosynthesis
MEQGKREKQTTFEVSDLTAVIWRRKWLIVLPLCLMTIVTLIGSYLITPEYESSVIIWIGNPVKLSLELRRMLGDFGEGYISDMDRQLELKSLQNEITSTPYIQQLVDNLKLDKDPNLEQVAWKAQQSNPDLTIDRLKSSILMNRLRSKINVSYAGKDQIEITVQSADPFQARDMAQNLGEIFISEKMKQELGSVRLSQDFSYEQLAKYDKDLQDKIDEKTRFEREYMKIKLNDLVISAENRKDINSEIDGTKIDIEEKKDEERLILGQLVDIPKKDLVLKETKDLKDLKDECSKLIESIANLMPQYTWSDPEILNYKARLFAAIEEIDGAIKESVDDQFSSYNKEVRAQLEQLFRVRTELDILYSKANLLRLAVDDLNGKANLIPEYDARLEQLTREVNAARDLRDKFKEQQETSQISQALLRESKYKVIEPAKIPLTPFKPQRKKIVIMGLLLGAAIGGAAAFLAELFDKSFRKVEEIEQAVGLPVIGVIPHIESLKKLNVR